MSLANRISYQINLIRQILDIYQRVSEEGVKQYNDIFEEIIDEYNINTADLIASTNSNSNDQLEDMISILNTESKIIELFNKLRAAEEFRLNKSLSEDMWEHHNNQLIRYQSVSRGKPVLKCSSCGGNVVIDSKTSTIRCESETCGATEIVSGVMNNISNMGTQIKQTVGTGREHENNLRKAINDLLNDNIQQIPKEDLDKIMYAIIHNKRRLITSITCDDVRIILKKLRLTIYNDKIPSILRRFATRIVYLFTENELALIDYYFKEASNIFDSHIKTMKRSNQIGKNFKIYKIAESIIDDNDRLDAIASLIHFPNQDTLIRYDNIWRATCEIMHSRGIRIKFKTTPYKRIQ